MDSLCMPAERTSEDEVQHKPRSESLRRATTCALVELSLLFLSLLLVLVMPPSRAFASTWSESRAGVSPAIPPFTVLGVEVERPVPAAGSNLGNLRNVVTLRADSQQMIHDVYRLEGHVDITYREMEVTADEATYNRSTGDVEARGHVTLRDPKAHLDADEGRYNVITEKGQFLNVRGEVHPALRPRQRSFVTENPFFLEARKVERLDENIYVVEDARLSTCEHEERGWSLTVHRARLTVGDKVVTYGDVFRLLDVPIFYAPALVHSIRRNPRQTGFLLPSIGNSSQKGTILGEGFFWAINPSVDLMGGLENYSKRGIARSARFRARPSDSSEVTVDYFGVSDRGINGLKAPGDSIHATGHTADLGYGFRGVLDVDYITSLAFRLTFTDNFTQAVSSETHQTGFLTKNFDAYSLNFFTSRYQNFLSTAQVAGNSIVIQHLPSFDFSGMDKQIGNTPFYFSFDTSVAGVARHEPGFETPDVTDRLDVFPEITLRSRPFAGFHLTPTVGVRATRYGTSLAVNHAPLTRLLGDFSLDLRPPSLEKVFSTTLFGYRIKHVFEPDIQYHLVRARDPENILDVVRFDDADIWTETNEIEYSVTNTLLGRKEAGGDGSSKLQARDLVSLRLSQKYYFDPTFGGALQPGTNVFEPTISLTGFAFARGERFSPVISVLKFAPFSNYDTELRADLDRSGRGVLNAGITSEVHRGALGLSATDFFVNHTASLRLPTAIVPAGTLAGLPSFNLLRTVITYGDNNRKGLSGALGLDYNFAQGIAHQVVAQGSYNFGCFGFDFGYRRFALGPLRRENQFRVALTLSNVGAFGNLRSRERLYR